MQNQTAIKEGVYKLNAGYLDIHTSLVGSRLPCKVSTVISMHQYFCQLEIPVKPTGYCCLWSLPFSSYWLLILCPDLSPAYSHIR